MSDIHVRDGRLGMKGKCVPLRNKKFISFFVTISMEFIVIPRELRQRFPGGKGSRSNSRRNNGFSIFATD